MTHQNSIVALALAAMMTTGCGGDKVEDSDLDTGDTTEDTATEDTAVQIAIPDPGDEYAPDRWYDDGGYHGTPETAQVMGVILDNPSYIQGGIDPGTGEHYFVFKTAPNVTKFSISLFDKTSQIESTHLHEGDGLVFGEKVAASRVVSPTRKTWDLDPDRIYVLKVSSSSGGFF